MKRFLISLAATSLLAAPALADDLFAFKTSADFQEQLEDEYGERELATLTEEIRKDISRELGKEGITAARIDVTILKAKPNRPTFQQLSDTPGLSLQSFSVGGMDLQATAYDVNEQVLGELEYGWFESDIRWSQGKTTWSDARKASDRFARKFAKVIAN